MVDSIRELLEESGHASEEALVEETRATTSRRLAKGWLVISGAIVLVAFGGTAGLLQKGSTRPQHSKHGAMPTNLMDLEDEHKHACDTFFDLKAHTSSNLGKTVSSSGKEGLIIPGTYHHAGADPVELEMHVHAVTDYPGPGYSSSHSANCAMSFSYQQDKKMARVVMPGSSETKFMVEFVKPGTDELYTLEQIAITFFDIDGSFPEHENVMLQPANEIVLADDYEVTVDDSQKAEGLVKFMSTTGKASLPKYYNKFLSESERTHAVEAIFYNMNTFNMTLKTGAGKDRWFPWVLMGAVQCAQQADGSDAPPVVVQTAKPVPSSDDSKKYCLLCWISSASWAQMFACTDAAAFWAKECAA